MSLPNELLPVGLLGTGAATSGYQISRSLRFNSADSAYLSRNVSSETNRKTFTFAAWVKRNKLGSGDYYLFHGVGGSGGLAGYTLLGFSADQLWFNDGFSGAITSTAKFRDPSAWYHVVFAVDSTQATDSNRVKMYVNGVQLTSLDVVAWPSLNRDFTINAAVQHTIGWYFSASNDFLLADVHFIDGQALTPSSFTEVSATTGQLIPKAYTGSFGTNGFWLKFSDNSAATATTLGKDYSGNSNNWTPNNLSVGGTQPALYSSPNLYTSAADVITNGTPLSSGSTFSNVYVYLVTNGGGDVGSKVFTADGSGNIGTNWTWLHRIGGSWTSSGSYNNSEWDLFTWGSEAVATNYIMNNSAPLHMLVSSAGLPQQVSGTIATFNSTPNSGAGNDSLVDTPTSYGTDTGAGGEVRGNYATLNPLAKGGDIQAPTNGNLQVTSSGSGYGLILGTIGMSSGKWYWEVTTTSANCATGIATNQANLASYGGADAYSWVWASYSGGSNKRNNGSQSSYGSILANGDVVGIAFDADNGTLTFYKNNVSQGAAYTGLVAGTYLPVLGDETASANIDLTVNFGQRPFAYTAPSGFKALCDTNLPAPVVAKSSDYFQTVLYTGNGSTQTISGLGFSPDFIWTKSRSRIDNNVLHDIVRGRTSNLYSDLAASENTTTTSTADLVSFNANGYTLGTVQQSAMNRSGETYVAWCFDAGSNTVSNTQGSITSTVRANPSSGFSIVGYTGTGSSGSLGHGLNVKPQLIIVKSRTQARDWLVYHSSYGATQYMTLNGTGAAAATSSAWNNTEPTSTVFTIGNAAEINTNGSTNIAYCFSPVAGYSSFGSYTGNGSADGPFVYTGMRTRWVLIKNTGAGGNVWVIYDTARDTYNIAGTELYPNLSNAETAGTAALDIVSNGFKIRTTSGGLNASGAVYIYAAFAENPFQYARAR